jgi:hypothetical protein
VCNTEIIGAWTANWGSEAASVRPIAGGAET